MLKKAAILGTALLLVGCAAERNRTDDPWARTGGDWADDCDKFYSETGRDYAACKDRLAHKGKHSHKSMGGSQAVTTTPHGAGTSVYQGIKENESTERG
ncbi:MAG: hypothetical protein ACPGXY_04525 [Alphaproteobacteria bacterium]